MPKNYLLKGDCLEFMRKLPDERFHAIVTDPPYGLTEIKPLHVQEALTAWCGGDREFVPATKFGFMSKTWDKFVPPPAVWDEAYRLLKPGGHMLVFAGARTYDLMGMSIRLAGFEIRDGLAWLYGQGMPKSKALLKGSFEPILLARKPFKGSLKNNLVVYGTGGLNIEATRIPFGDESVDLERRQINFDRMGYGGAQNTDGVPLYKSGGRWPANVVLDESQAAALDEQTGVLKSGKVGPDGLTDNGKEAGVYGAFEGSSGREVYGDEGGASRFFYVAKASGEDRVGYWKKDCECLADTSRQKVTEDSLSKADKSLNTSTSGSLPTDPSHLDTTSTTSTGSRSTIDSRTSGLSPSSSTSASTPAASFETESGGSPVESVTSSSPSPKSTGTSRKRGGRATGAVDRVTSELSWSTSVCAVCGTPYKAINHETVKPVSLMRWGIRLITPTVEQLGEAPWLLDMFAGSGTTGVAGAAEDCNVVLVENEETYWPIIEERLERVETTRSAAG
jgi:site-specific DNA-methyltransferase (adenine-specific)